MNLKATTSKRRPQSDDLKATTSKQRPQSNNLKATTSKQQPPRMRRLLSSKSSILLRSEEYPRVLTGDLGGGNESDFQHSGNTGIGDGFQAP